MNLTISQKLAVDWIASWAKTEDPSCVSLTGPAGTGKTTVLRHLLDAGAFAGDWIILTAMTGKAAQRVREVVGVEATTLHKRLYYPPKSGSQAPVFGSMQPAPGGILVVDEASMMPPAVWDDLQVWIQEGTRILLVGDSFQLPPVLTSNEEKDWGNDFSVFGIVKGPELAEVVRTGDDVLRVATVIRSGGEIPRQSSGAYLYRRAQLPQVMKDYLDDPDEHVVVTWRNDVRMEGNHWVRQARACRGILDRGEEVLFCRNGQGVLNGDVGRVDRMEEGPQIGAVPTWMLAFEGGMMPVLVSCTGRDSPMDGAMPFLEGKAWSAYCAARRKENVPDPIPITYGYVLTAHKAQGSEYRRVSVFLTEKDTWSRNFRKPSKLPDGTVVEFWRRWLYTSATRSKGQLEINIS